MFHFFVFISVVCFLFVLCSLLLDLGGAEDLGLMASGAELGAATASCYFRPWFDEFWSCEQSASVGHERHSGRHSQIALAQHHLHLCTPQGCTR